MNWIHKYFSDLTPAELYQILKLRQDVFIIEQDCIYPDIDGSDHKAEHLFAWDEDGVMIAYSRIFAPGIKFDEASIGRIIIHPEQRGKNLGKQLVEQGIQLCLNQFTNKGIRIEAQSHLENFYAELGFKRVSDAYYVDGIDHIQMIYSK